MEAKLRSEDSGAFRWGVVEMVRRRRIVCVVGTAEGKRGWLRRAEDRRSLAVCLEARSIVGE